MIALSLLDTYRWRVVRRRAARAQQAALEVIARNRHLGSPFALFLRDFDWDITGSFDARLRQAIEHHMPIIKVCDARDPRQFWLREARDNMPALILKEETWKADMEYLVSRARLIVIRCLYLSPGVESELRLISQLERKTSTVVLLPPAGTDPLAGIPSLRTGPTGMLETRNYPKAKSTDSRFRGFAAAISEDEIPTDLADLPGVTRLLRPKA